MSPDFTLRLPARFRTEEALDFLARDADSPVERVDGRTAWKAFGPDDDGAAAYRLRIRLRGDRAACAVQPGPGTAAPGPQALADARTRAGRILGLTCEPAPFERLVAGRKPMGRLVARRPGLRIPLAGDVFEALVWAVVGQQVTIGFAAQLRRTLVELCGADAGGGMRAHPGPAAVARLEYADLTARKYSRRKAEYLIDAARAIAGGELSLDFDGLAAAEAERTLLAVRGIGPWTARYVLLRGAGLPDCVPVGDVGLAEALRRVYDLDARPDAAETERLMAPFAPYRSLATYHLWRSLGDEP